MFFTFANSVLHLLLRLSFSFSLKTQTRFEISEVQLPQEESSPAPL
jgi:hypothetical protein